MLVEGFSGTLNIRVSMGTGESFLGCCLDLFVLSYVRFSFKRQGLW